MLLNVSDKVYKHNNSNSLRQAEHSDDDMYHTYRTDHINFDSMDDNIKDMINLKNVEVFTIERLNKLRTEYFQYLYLKDKLSFIYDELLNDIKLLHKDNNATLYISIEKFDKLTLNDKSKVLFKDLIPEIDEECNKIVS